MLILYTFRSVVKRGQDGEGKERSPVPHLYKQSYKANQANDGGEIHFFKTSTFFF